MSRSKPALPVHHHLRSSLKLTPIESVMPSSHLILCRLLLLLPSIFPSIRVFSGESDLHIRWLKYWSFSFSISPSIEYSGLIFFRMDWLDLLAVQGTLKSLLQHHSTKASILQHSAFFTVQLSHPYVTTGKTIALTRRSCSYFSWQSWFQLVLHPTQHFECCTLHRSEISRVTIYSIVVLLSQFWTSLLFHVQLFDLHTGLAGDR